MDDQLSNEAAHFSLKGRVMRRRAQAMTPAQRMAAFERLQESSFRILKSNPDGYARYIARNHKSRRVKEVNGQWIPVSPDRPAPPA